MKGFEYVLSKVKNPFWLVNKSYLLARSMFSVKKDDVVVVCFTKTGSTWLRIVLYNFLMGHKSEDSFTFNEVEATIADFGNENFVKKWPFKHCPRIIYTRHYYSSLFRNNKVIFLVRDPRDIMISTVPYANSKKSYKFTGGLHEVVYHKVLGLENFLKLNESWKSHVDLLVRYEDLRSDPHKEFGRVLDCLGMEYTAKQLQTALDCSSLEKTREAQQNSSVEFKAKFKEGFVFARKGGSGEGKQVFDKDLNEYYKQLRDKYNFDLYPY